MLTPLLVLILTAAPPDSALAATAARWRVLDVAAFTAAPAPADDALLQGLKALVDADFDAADRALREALAAAPDSLKPFVRARLAETAQERFDWAAAVALRAEDDPAAHASVEAGFARFPAARLRLDAAETTVAFDGLRVPGAVNGAPVRAVVDTGAPGSSVSRALARRLSLWIDTTARGRSGVPSLGIAFDTYAVLLDSVRLGDATLFNVPATVGWRDAEPASEDEIFLGADVLRHLAGALRYGYADSTFTLVRDRAVSAEPPTFVIDAGSAPVVAVTVAGQPANAILDTGNQRAVYLARGAFSLEGIPVSRTLTGSLPGGGTWTQAFVRLPFGIPGHPPLTLDAYEAEFVFRAGDPITVVLGRTTWAGGTLTVDAVNRRVDFEAR